MVPLPEQVQRCPAVLPGLIVHSERAVHEHDHSVQACRQISELYQLSRQVLKHGGRVDLGGLVSDRAMRYAEAQHTRVVRNMLSSLVKRPNRHTRAKPSARRRLSHRTVRSEHRVRAEHVSPANDRVPQALAVPARWLLTAHSSRVVSLRNRWVGAVPDGAAVLHAGWGSCSGPGFGYRLIAVAGRIRTRVESAGWKPTERG